MPTYQPDEALLRDLGFRTKEAVQPYATRFYTRRLSSGHWLGLVPRPGLRVLTEFNRHCHPVATRPATSATELREACTTQRGRKLIPLT